MGFHWQSVVNPEFSIYSSYGGFAPIGEAVMAAGILDDETTLPEMPAELAALSEVVCTDEDARRYEEAYFARFSARSPLPGKTPAWKIVHAEPAGFDRDEVLLLAQALAPLASSAALTSFIAAFHAFLLRFAELKGGMRK